MAIPTTNRPNNIINHPTLLIGAAAINTAPMKKITEAIMMVGFLPRISLLGPPQIAPTAAAPTVMLTNSSFCRGVSL